MQSQHHQGQRCFHTIDPHIPVRMPKTKRGYFCCNSLPGRSAVPRIQQVHHVVSRAAPNTQFVDKDSSAEFQQKIRFVFRTMWRSCPWDDPIQTPAKSSFISQNHENKLRFYTKHWCFYSKTDDYLLQKRWFNTKHDDPRRGNGRTKQCRRLGSAAVALAMKDAKLSFRNCARATTCVFALVSSFWMKDSSLFNKEFIILNTDRYLPPLHLSHPPSILG